MLVSEALNEIRLKINDRDSVGLDDSELLSYLNEAVQYISNAMIGYSSPQLAKDVTVTEATFALPDNFAKWAGNYPVKLTGATVTLLDTPPVTLRYLAGYPILETTDDMPFNNTSLTQIAIRLACIYAQNQEKEDVTQDRQLVQEIQQAIAASMGAGT